MTNPINEWKFENKMCDHIIFLFCLVEYYLYKSRKYTDIYLFFVLMFK